ncbi:DUF3303 domain-containing protein [Nocardia sp. NPDC004123]
MLIERYPHGPAPVYARAVAWGRMLPPGLVHIDSWVVDDTPLNTCFRLIEAADEDVIGVWIASWTDLVDFEVFPVITVTAWRHASRATNTPTDRPGDNGTCPRWSPPVRPSRSAGR